MKFACAQKMFMNEFRCMCRSGDMQHSITHAAFVALQFCLVEHDENHAVDVDVDDDD